MTVETNLKLQEEVVICDFGCGWQRHFNNQVNRGLIEVMSF